MTTFKVTLVHPSLPSRVVDARATDADSALGIAVLSQRLRTHDNTWRGVIVR